MTLSPARSLSAVRRRLALLALALIVLSAASLEGFVIPILPRLQTEFAVTPAVGALATVVPTVVTVIVTPIAGSLADVHGAERILGWLAAITTAGGLLSAFAPQFALFVVGQAMQGFALGIIPVGFVVIRRMVAAEAVRTASGVLVAMSVAGAGIGVLLAGPIIEATSRGVLYAVPTALVALGTVAFFAIRGRAGRPTASANRLDWRGAGALTLALLLLVAALSLSSSAGWLSPITLALVALAGLAWLCWIRVEARVAHPMIDMGTLRSRAVGGAVLVGVAIGAGYAPMVFLIPQLVSRPVASGFGFGASPSETSALLAVAYAAGILASLAAGPLSRPWGLRTSTVITMIILGAGAAVCVITPAAPPLVFALILAGFGAGGASTLVYASAAAGATPEKVGVSTALITISRAIGGAVATQVVASVIGGTDPTFGDFQLAFVIAAVIAAGGALAALLLFPRDAAVVTPGAVVLT